MRSDVMQYDLTAPPSLDALLARMAAEPGQHTPLAGGTEIMVQLGVGRLAAKSLVSLLHFQELRFIREREDEIELGALTTFTDIRNHEAMARELPLLIQSASWTGAIANQNRATLGGNIVNASPAADNPPALLAYDASVTMISAQGKRTIPYGEFHLGYKKTALRADELLYSVTVPIRWSPHRQYIRKVGTRNSLAISKVALACVARMEEGRIAELRVGAASLADRPLRCIAAETMLTGMSVEAADLEATVRAGRAALAQEAQPIDDIRSTGRYRSVVAANLLEEFLRSLAV